MSDREALLAAVAANPADDAPRLVYADWLDEHGDPARAEFIRLQIELDPLERQPDTDLANWQRAFLRPSLDGPVPTGFPESMHRYAELARREGELLHAHQSRWLGPLNAVDNDYASHVGATFRRGFIDEVALTASAFLDSAEAVRAACPALRRLTLYGPRDRGPELAASPALHGIPELDLAGWITPFDARFLAPFLAVNPVRSLTVWIGSQDDDEVLRTLATRPWADDATGPFPRDAVLAAGPYLGRLEELVLVQLYGGRMAADPGAVDRRTDDLAGRLNDLLGRPVVRVERPYARRFPLNGVLGRSLFAGHLAGEPVLVCGGRQAVVLSFDADGRLAGERVLDLAAELHRPPRWSWMDHDEDEFEQVIRRRGYEPGPIFVREFSTEDVGVYLWGMYEETIEDPDSAPDADDQEEACASLSGYWWRGGNFVIEYGNDYWAGPDGGIHTS